MVERDDATRVRLGKIAYLLGIPTETFRVGSAAGDTEELAEFMRLWLRMTDPARRTAALDVMRELLNEDGGKT